MKAVFFDFDGVLSCNWFYTNLEKQYPHVLEYINQTIFRGNEKYSDRWMRGEFSYQDINKLISEATGIPLTALTELFIESVRNFTLVPEMIGLARQLKERGTPIALVTNNMDVFNEITIPTHRLNEVFPVIVNSADHGALKHEQEGLLFDLALEGLGLDSFEDVLLIDDSEKACAMFESKGGRIYRFTDLESFREWKPQEWSSIS